MSSSACTSVVKLTGPVAGQHRGHGKTRWPPRTAAGAPYAPSTAAAAPYACTKRLAIHRPELLQKIGR